MFLFLDLFPQTVNFYYRGAFKQSSGIGILFSLGIYGLIIFSFIKSDMNEKNSPIVVSQSLQTTEARKINFNENRIISFRVNDVSKKAHMDPSIFNIVFRYFHNFTYFENRALKPCSLDDVAFNTSIYEMLNMDNSFCLENKKFDLDGSVEENHLSYIAISLFLCNNSTSNGTCKSQEEIDNFFNNWSGFKFFSVQYHNTKIDLSDFENPFKITIKSEYQFVDTFVKKRFTIFLKNADVLTDDGWIFASEKVESNIMFDSKEFDFQIRSDKTQPVFQILFFASKEVVKSTRRYQKLPEILGSIAGMIQFIMIFCTLIVKLATYVSTLNYITNKLYFFEEIQTQKHENTNQLILTNSIMKSKTELETEFPKKFVSPLKEPSLQNKDSQINSSNALFPKTLKQDSFVLEHFSEENEIRKNENDGTKTEEFKIKKNDKIKPEKKPKKITLLKLFQKKKKNFDSMKADKNPKNYFTLSYFEYIWFKLAKIFFKKTPKEKLIYQTEMAFMNDMDIVNFVTKFHDLEKLKILLLDEDQLILFKYLTKPIITSNNEKNIVNQQLNTPQMKMSCLLNSQVKEGKYVEESYKKVFFNQTSNNINKRMIELLDAKVSNWGRIKNYSDKAL